MTLSSALSTPSAASAALSTSAPGRLVSMRSYDLAVIGAGILGLGVARELLHRFPRLRLDVLDKEPRVGQHKTGHNSGVIHSGIYYVPGSLKARLCVEGAARLYEYCAANGIEAVRCGKLVIAVREAELPRLGGLGRRPRANGVP